jgi:glycosyltransferase involved in cell wall biosynthesis
MMNLNHYQLIVFTDWFVPGLKAGGPITSIRNMVENLSKFGSILIVTGDRDLGDSAPYPNVKTNKVVAYIDNVDVFYIDKNKMSFNRVRIILKKTKPKTIYLNSMYSFRFSFIPAFVGQYINKQVNVVLAPRGMLNKNAIAIKNRKKKIYLRFFKLLKFNKTITFQATDQNEKSCIQLHLNTGSVVVSNFPFNNTSPLILKSKERGVLQLLSTSRVSPEKNTLAIYKALANVSDQYQISHKLIGPLQSSKYWEECQSVIRLLPAHIKTEYLGVKNNNEVRDIIQNSHAFLLPTLGENFGHAIFEALSFGKPVIISDQTRWLHLQDKKVGWALPLDNINRFTQAIEQLADMDQEQYNGMSQNAFQLAKDHLANSSLTDSYRALFEI